MRTLACPTCGAPQPEAPSDRSFLCPFCKTRIEPDAARTMGRYGGGPVRETRGGCIVAVAVIVVLFVMGAAGAMFFTLRRSSAPPPSLDPVAVVPSAVPPSPLVAATTTTSSKPVDAVPLPSVDLETNPVTLVWHAHVRAATGDRPIAVGTSCTLTEVVAHGAKRDSVDTKLLTFECGGKMLYDSSVPLEGMANMSSAFEEVAVAGQVNAFQYEVKEEDVGTRSGDRNQIVLNTHDGFVEAFRDMPPDFHVKATVDKLTAIRHGKPIVESSVPSFSDVVRRTAKVTSRSGAVPFSGNTCDLAISPAGAAEKNNCRVLLTCGGKVVFGAGTGGFEKCTMQNGEPESLVDPYPTPKDTDPELSVDLDAATATLGDTLPGGGQYTVSFALTTR
jgi:hypothetical protein